MRILYYNWIDYLDDLDKRGGGVTVYQKNLIDSLASQNDMDIYFLSSGTEYGLFSKQPYVRELKPYRSTRRFELVNSELPAPGHLGFDNPASIRGSLTEHAFAMFLREHGPFDVVHFNNLEGIPVKILELKLRHPGTRFILSLHNYYSVCPQVNLWWREKENCTDYNHGRNCPACLDYEPNSSGMKKANRVTRVLNRLGMSTHSSMHRFFFFLIRDVNRLQKAVFAKEEEAKLIKVDASSHTSLEYQQRRRREFAHYINRYCDAALAVSNRVSEVVTRFGINPGLVRTLYIGTKVAESFKRPDLEVLRQQISERHFLTLGYLGYMRRDKGFYFLIDALETIPGHLASRINLIIAAKLHDPSIMKRLALLADRFHSVEFCDGYTHDMLDGIYDRMDLAVVPVLWEDNLPQVAIESVCHHTPVLTSNLGGAQELGCYNPLFTFKANDKPDFTARLKTFVEEPMRLLEYWDNVMVPVTMDRHIDELINVYREDSRDVLPQLEFEEQVC
jgi:glycosyltransferase involved in cell wall biosynthesis